MLSKNDYGVLLLLYNEGCNTEFKSYTKKNIKERLEKENIKLSINKITNTLKTSIKMNYVNEGARQWQSKTYYITKKGIEKIEKNV